MNASFIVLEKGASGADRHPLRALRGAGEAPASDPETQSGFRFASLVDDLINVIAPCPWEAHAGGNPFGNKIRKSDAKRPLYTPQERVRRDASGWTIVQGVLAPLQFLVFATSLGLVARYLMTGRGYELATASILVKTVALYTIMITGSIWEKEVFGKWLFARAFFWEDVFSMLVLGLQTTYLGALLTGWGSPRQQMLIAVAAYAAYVINAAQFILKLRAARLEGGSNDTAPGQVARPA